MKKLITWQVIISAIVLATFFVTLHLTGNEYSAIVFATSLCFALFAGIAFVVVATHDATPTMFAIASAISNALMGTISIAATSITIGISIGMGTIGVVVMGIITANSQKLSKVKVIASYIVQFLAILLPLLYALGGK